jgi:hypothetical protein
MFYRFGSTINSKLLPRHLQYWTEVKNIIVIQNRTVQNLNDIEIFSLKNKMF